VVTKPTGNRPGRPRVSFRDDPLRFDLALAEAIRRGLKVSAQKARALAVMALRADPRQETGVGIMSFDISTFRAGPNARFERDLSKRIQAINTLEKKAKRGIAEDDREYFTTLSACYYAALFGKGSIERRAIGIELLSKEIGEAALARPISLNRRWKRGYHFGAGR
jgi:hypothetical protein